MLSAVLTAVISVFTALSFLCECRVRWLANAFLHLPPGDEMYRTPYGAKFLPEILLRRGVEVIRGNITYQVVGVVIMTINNERWLFYQLKCYKIKRRVALGVNIRNGELHLRWWWGDGNYYSKRFMRTLSALTSKVVDFSGESYVRVGCGHTPFMSLGSTGYPKQHEFEYSLFQGAVQPLGQLIGCRWLLSLMWLQKTYEGKSILCREVFFGEDIEVEDVMVRQSIVDSLWHRLLTKCAPPPIEMDLDEAFKKTRKWEKWSDIMFFGAACTIMYLEYIMFGDDNIIGAVMTWILVWVVLLITRLPRLEARS